MLSHRHLRRLLNAGKTAIATMRRRIGCGMAPDLAMVDALEEIEEAHDALALLDPDELSSIGIDWECAGLVMTEALRLALKVQRKTGSDAQAVAAFSKRVERLTKPKLVR